MARALALVGVVALASGQAYALPHTLTPFTTTTPVGEWEEAALEAQRAAAASVAETINMEGSNYRMMAPAPEAVPPLAVQEEMLDSIMKEVQTIFKNTLTVPGWDNMDSAAETVKHIVDRVRERLSSPTLEEAGRATMTTAAALRGVTTDFMKEMMVQEAVIETLWALLRDNQARPWISGEQPAMHVAASHAVQGFLLRMQDRLKASGFSDEEIMKVLPRAKVCTREGPNGVYDCPEAATTRTLGKKGRSSGYYGGYYPTSYYHYPWYGYGYEPIGYGYGWSYPYYGGWGRRLGTANTTPVMTVGPMATPKPMQQQFTGTTTGPETTLTEGTTPRMLQGELSSFGRGWGHGGGYGGGYGGHGGQGHGGWGHGHGHGHGHGYGYGGWGHGGGYGHGGNWGGGHGGHYGGGYGYPSYGYYGSGMRRLEVPEIATTTTDQVSPMSINDTITDTTTTTGRNTTGFSFRRLGETRVPTTQGTNVFYNTQSTTPFTPDTPYYNEPTSPAFENTWDN